MHTCKVRVTDVSTAEGVIPPWWGARYIYLLLIFMYMYIERRKVGRGGGNPDLQHSTLLTVLLHHLLLLRVQPSIYTEVKVIGNVVSVSSRLLTRAAWISNGT